MKVQRRIFAQYAHIILVFSYYFIKYSAFGVIADALIILSIPFFAYGVLLNCHTLKQLCSYIAIIAVGGIVFLYTNEASMLLSCTVLLSTNRIEKNKIYNILFVTSIVLFVVVTGFSLVGVGNWDSGIRNDAVRYSLGFAHANRLALITFIISELWILKKIGNVRNGDWIVFGTINAFGYIMTRSNTVLLVTMLTFLMLLGNKFKIYQKIQYICFPLAYPIVLFCAYYGSLHRTEGIWNFINVNMSYRLSWGYLALSSVPIKYLPQDVSFGNIVDCGALAMLLKLGIIGVVLYWLLYVIYWKKYYWKTNDEVNIFILISIVYMFSEDIALIICYNPALICLAKVIWSDNRTRLEMGREKHEH